MSAADNEVVVQCQAIRSNGRRKKRCSSESAHGSSYCDHHQYLEVADAQRVVSEVSDIMRSVPNADVLADRARLEDLTRQLAMVQTDLAVERKTCMKNKQAMSLVAKQELETLSKQLQEFMPKLEMAHASKAQAIQALTEQLNNMTEVKEAAVLANERFLAEQADLRERVGQCDRDQGECMAKWSELQGQHDQIIATLQKERTDREEEMAKITSELNKAQKQYDDAAAQVETMKSEMAQRRATYFTELQNKDAQADQMQTQLTEAQVRVREHELAVENMTREYEAMKEQLARQSEEHERNLASALQSYDTRVAEMQAGYAKARKERESSFTARMDTFQAMEDRSRQDVNALTTERDRLTNELATATNELEIKSRTMDQLRQEHLKTKDMSTLQYNELRTQTEKVRNELSQLMTNNRELGEQLRAAQDSLEDRNTLLAALESQKKEMTAAHERIMAEMTANHEQQSRTLQSEFEDYRKRTEERFKTDQNSCERKVTERESAIQSKQREVEKAMKEAQRREFEYERKIASLETAHGKKEAAFVKIESDLNQRLSNLTTKLDEKSNILQDRENKVSALEAVIKAKVEEISRVGAVYEGRMKDMESKFNATEAQRAELEAKNVDLTSQLTSKVKTLKERTSELDTTNKEVERLRIIEIQMAESQRELNTTLQMLKQQKADHATLTGEYESKIQKLAATESDLSRVQNEYDALQSRLATMTNQIATLQQSQKATMQEYAQCNKLQSDLTTQLQGETHAKEAVESQLDECRAAKGRCATSLDQSNSNIADLTNMQNELEAKIREKEEEMSILGDKCSRDAAMCQRERDQRAQEFEAERQAFRRQIEETVSQAKRVQSVMDQLTKDHEEQKRVHEQFIIQSQSNSQTLQDEIKQLTSSNQQYKVEMEELRKAHEAVIREMRGQLTAAQKRVGEIESEMETLRGECDATRGDIANNNMQCERSLEERTSELTVLQQAKARMEATMAAAEERMKTEQSKCESYRSANMAATKRFQETVARLTRAVPADQRANLIAELNQSMEG